MLAVGATTLDHWAKNGGPRWPHRPVRTSMRRTAAAWVRPPCFTKAIFEGSALGLAQEAPIAVRTTRRTARGVRASAMVVDRSPGGSSPRTARELTANGIMAIAIGARRPRGRPANPGFSRSVIIRERLSFASPLQFFSRNHLHIIFKLHPPLHTLA